MTIDPDDCEREAAARDDRALVAYLEKWTRTVQRLQRAHPERWQVPGLSDEEVRDALTLRLFEAVRAGEAQPSSWAILTEQLGQLRKSFRLGAVATDFRTARLLEHTASIEERYLESEATLSMKLARARAEQGLTRPQRRGLAAFELSARCGAFFESSAEPNLSAASRMLGKHRSSAQRAYRELQERFGEERERLE